MVSVKTSTTLSCKPFENKLHSTFESAPSGLFTKNCSLNMESKECIIRDPTFFKEKTPKIFKFSN